MANANGIIQNLKLYTADARRIKISGQIRKDLGDLSEIKASITANGYQRNKPLVLRRIDGEPDFDFELRGRGERRLRSVMELLDAKVEFPGWENGIPFVLEDKAITDRQAMLNDAVDNSQKPLTPLEEAQFYADLMKDVADTGEKAMTVKEIAAKVHKSEGHIRWTLGLLDADQSVKDALTEGKISGVQAKQIAQKGRGNVETQKELVDLATSGKAGKKLAKEAASKIQRRKVTGKSKKDDVPPQKALTLSQMRTRHDLVFHKLEKQYAALETSHPELMKKIRMGAELKAIFNMGALAALNAAMGNDAEKFFL